MDVPRAILKRDQKWENVMFGLLRKKSKRTDCTFTTMLVVEILRKELQAQFGECIYFFQMTIEADSPRQLQSQSENSTITDLETDFLTWKNCLLQEKTIRINATIGPFERPKERLTPGDLIYTTGQVQATCRLFCTTENKGWSAHYLDFSVDCPTLPKLHSVQYYESGTVDFTHHEKNTQIPCELMLWAAGPNKPF